MKQEFVQFDITKSINYHGHGIIFGLITDLLNMGKQLIFSNNCHVGDYIVTKETVDQGNIDHLKTAIVIDMKEYDCLCDDEVILLSNISEKEMEHYISQRTSEMKEYLKNTKTYDVTFHISDRDPDEVEDTIYDFYKGISCITEDLVIDFDRKPTATHYHSLSLYGNPTNKQIKEAKVIKILRFNKFDEYIEIK